MGQHVEILFLPDFWIDGKTFKPTHGIQPNSIPLNQIIDDDK